ncbi:hypothetical protein HBH90_103300 [Parastagonospora nodorum]|nr:hypothetical protein HBI02_153800 [Parastagonospora nodorum]KAH4300838.1 hypothetical protein HBI01_102340 [Parastagonospora nodorum]KAH4464805.1 hypothetical protein HBH90_103300 [Parastagonospora nodorum]KAH4672910.1 hypothetical protein HBH80_072490 [Parastagonospora nodorum]KAH4827199.1 hypothetical protein HBH60_121010 [Parastagonospora nodorum]
MRSCLGVYVKDIDREALRLIGVRSFIEDFSRRQLVRPNSSMLLFAFIFALFFSVLQLCNARFLDLTFTLRCSLAQRNIETSAVNYNVYKLISVCLYLYTTALTDAFV